MSRQRYIAFRLDGSVTMHANRVAVERAKRRAVGSRTIIETRREGERLPHPNDAQGWDDYRVRHGYTGGR